MERKGQQWKIKMMFPQMSETMPVKKESGRICVTRKDDVPVVVISPARNKNGETVNITEAQQSQK